MGVLVSEFGVPGVWRRLAVLAAFVSATALLVVGSANPADAIQGSVTADVTTAPTADAPETGEPLTAPDRVSAVTIARLEGEPVEVLGERTITSSVFALPDGTMAAGMSSGPIWVPLGGDGTQVEDWAPVDLTLQAGTDGLVRPVAHPAGLVVSGGSAAGTAADAEVLVASLTTETGVTSAINWVGPLPVPRLDGARAIFEDVRPDTDMVIEATTSGFEQFFVVQQAPAAEQQLSLPVLVAAEGATVTEAADGALEVVDGAGEVVAGGPVPMMWDATADADRVHPVTEPWQPLAARGALTPPAGFLDGTAGADRAGEGRKSTPPPATAMPGLDPEAELTGPQAPAMADQEVVTRTVAPRADGVQVDLTPQADFLADPETAYPVVIDPYLSIMPGFDTTVQSNVGYDLSGSSELLLGTWNSGATVHRSFLNFHSEQVQRSTIIEAQLSLNEFHSWSCTPANWQVWDTTPADWDTRWSNQPAWWAHYATSSATKGFSSACPAGQVTVPITSLVQKWANASPAIWFGIGLKAENETSNFGWKRFYSGETTLSPLVWVHYNAIPKDPTGLTVSPAGSVVGGVRYINSTTPQLSAVVEDEEKNAMTVVFQVLLNGQPYFEGVVNNVASGTAATWTVPAGRLVPGQPYSFHVQARDSTGWSPWVKYGSTFVIDTTVPLAPVVTSSTFPSDGTWAGQPNQAGSFTITPPASDPTVVNYLWGLDTVPDPSKKVSAAGGALQVTPTTAGKHVLQVQALDRAGNVSSVVKYAFNVGTAGIVTPEDASQVVRRTRLFVTARPEMTHVQFQWRRGPDSTTITGVPTAHLSAADGQPWTGTWQELPKGAAGYTTWDMGATLGHQGGPLQVRAKVAKSATGTEAYETPWINLTLDPDADGAAATGIGPGQVNLLTGDHSLSSTDAEEFGLSVVRTASSRDIDAGYQLQKEQLTEAQQKMTALTGISGNGSSTVSIATGQFHTGTTSLKIVPPASGSSHDTYASIGGDAGAMRWELKAGRTYRVSGWVYVPDSATQPANPSALSLGLFWNVGANYNAAKGAGNAEVRGVWQRVQFDATIPATSTQAFLRAYNGFTAGTGQAVYWDDISVREIWSPLGKEWQLGGVDYATGTAYTRISKPYDDVAAVHLSGGGEIWFTSGNGSAWWPQPGAEFLKLTSIDANKWRLTELDGTVTEFERQGASKDFQVARTSLPGSADASPSESRYVYDITTIPGVSRPSRIIAPVEPGVDGWPDNKAACTTTTPAPGCEVMDLTYAGPTTPATTTATVFGDYAGRLVKVSVWSWDPVTQAMVATDVVRYAYDSAGRLRLVADPRIVAAGAPELSTTYTYDTAGRVATVTDSGDAPYRFTYGAGGGQTGSGDWIDPGAGRLLKVTRASLLPGTSDQWGPDNTTTVVYAVPLTRAAGGPYDLAPADLATWIQRDGPSDATAVFGPQDPPSVTTATASTPGPDGYRPATVHYLNASGLEVNTASPASADAPVEGFIDTAEFDRFGNVVRTLDATNRLLALKKLPGWEESLTAWGLQTTPTAHLAQLLDSQSTYSTDGLDVLTQLGPIQQLAVANDGTTVRTLRPRARYVYDQGKPDGAAYHLVTTTTSDGFDPVSQQGFDAVDTVNEYTPIDGASPVGGSSGWVHKRPTRVTVDAGQPTATSATVVYDDQGRVVRSSKPGSTGTDAATTTSLYYTADAHPADALCGKRPEWAGQPCLTQAAGPITGHDPTRMAGQLPVRRVTGYNKFGSPTVVTDTVTGPVDGITVTQTRTATTTYDAADRVVSVELTGTGTGVGLPVAKTRSTYHPLTGEVTTIESLDATGTVTGVVSKELDALGRLIRYTDAHGGWTTTTYDRYGQPATETEGFGGTTIGSRTFTYDRAQDPRGYLTSLTDSVAGTITATWGPDGQLQTQTLPGGVTLSIGYDPARVPTSRTYTRASDGQVIWTDSVIENHRGQWLQHTSTTGTANYTYDRLGRLTQVTDRHAGADVCTTRAYGFAGNPRTNRTQQATGVGEAGAPCPTAVLATTATYDSADRLTNPGWVYDPLGRVTTMPDTAGGASVVNGYFVNDLVASQTQPGTSRVTWELDPIQRRTTNTIEAWVNDAWASSVTKVSHYATDSDEPTWIAEDTTLPSDITRYVSGVEGDLAVTTDETGALELQLVDLHGDVVGTIPITDKTDPATWAGLVFTRTDEFGNPTPLTGAATPTGPPRYGWLGAAQRSGEALGGVILMGVRLYHPVTGRFLSVDPVPGGSANAYDYCNADPVNCTDLGGTFSFKGLIKAVAVVGELGSMIPGPIGAAAGAVSAVAYAADGNTIKALEMGVTAAAALVGAGALVKVAARAVSAARVAGKAVARAAPKVSRAVLARVGAALKRGCNSFVPGTLVVMADGSLAPIETLESGDLVLAADPSTGETSTQPVITPIIGSGDKHLVDVVTDAGSWTATANHPIWVVDRGWTNARELAVGDELLGSTGNRLVVRAVQDLGWLGGQTVYNLSVGGVHTYYVASAETAGNVLVHNASCSIAAHSTPRQSGIYVLRYSDGRLPYVGKAMNAHRRAHAHNRSLRKGFTSVDVYPTLPDFLPYAELAMWNKLGGKAGTSNAIKPGIPKRV